MAVSKLALFFAFTLPASAQVFEVTPLFGYRMGGSVKVQQENEQTYASGKLKDSFAYGFAFGYRLDEKSVIEFRWTRQHTDLRLPDPVDPAVVSSTNGTVDTTIDQFHGDFTREYIVDRQSAIRPYVLASLGASRIGLPGADLTRFSFGLGAGVKFPIHRRVRWRIQAAWLPIWIEPGANGLICRDGGCAAFLSGTLAHQFEISFGPVFHFSR